MSWAFRLKLYRIWHNTTVSVNVHVTFTHPNFLQPSPLGQVTQLLLISWLGSFLTYLLILGNLPVPSILGISVDNNYCLTTEKNKLESSLKFLQDNVKCPGLSLKRFIFARNCLCCIVILLQLLPIPHLIISQLNSVSLGIKLCFVT